MTGLAPFCFLPPGHVPGAELAGGPDDSVSALSVAGMEVWVREVGRAPAPDPGTVRRHLEVVDAAWRCSPACLPARFGQWFETRRHLEQAVSQMREQLLRGLSRVRGAGELAVRVVERGAAPEREPGTRPFAEGPGRAYLERLREASRRSSDRERRRSRLAEELTSALGDVVTEQRIDALPEADGLATVAHLVAMEWEEEYLRRMEAFRKSRPDLRLTLAGPWPPYSFSP